MCILFMICSANLCFVLLWFLCFFLYNRWDINFHTTERRCIRNKCSQHTNISKHPNGTKCIVINGIFTYKCGGRSLTSEQFMLWYKIAPISLRNIQAKNYAYNFSSNIIRRFVYCRFVIENYINMPSIFECWYRLQTTHPIATDHTIHALPPLFLIEKLSS